MNETRWSPEQLGELKSVVDAARRGDVEAAVSLLDQLADCLEEDWPIPRPLASYFAAAIREITGNPASGGPPRITTGSIGSQGDLKEFLERRRELGDARSALNLKRRSRRKLAYDELFTSFFLAYRVSEKARDWKPSGLRGEGGRMTQLYEQVAEEQGISEKTVRRAWRECKEAFELPLDK